MLPFRDARYPIEIVVGAAAHITVVLRVSDGVSTAMLAVIADLPGIAHGLHPASRCGCTGYAGARQCLL
jgi:hypothetical protein